MQITSHFTSPGSRLIMIPLIEASVKSPMVDTNDKDKTVWR